MKHENVCMYEFLSNDSFCTDNLCCHLLKPCIRIIYLFNKSILLKINFIKLPETQNLICGIIIH